MRLTSQVQWQSWLDKAEPVGLALALLMQQTARLVARLISALICELTVVAVVAVLCLAQLLELLAEAEVGVVLAPLELLDLLLPEPVAPLLKWPPRPLQVPLEMPLEVAAQQVVQLLRQLQPRPNTVVEAVVVEEMESEVPQVVVELLWLGPVAEAVAVV
jgi:hypothetical protein